MSPLTSYVHKPVKMYFVLLDWVSSASSIKLIRDCVKDLHYGDRGMVAPCRGFIVHNEPRPIMILRNLRAKCG